MPREIRKRGRRHKKSNAEENPTGYDAIADTSFSIEEQPKWILPTEKDPEAPFGYVSPDLKAYFRTVDEKLQEWQNSSYGHEKEDTSDDRRLFLIAALEEMSGQEKQLATDPDCSTILERMEYSMDDFVKRVFMDRFAGSYCALVKHRFASHVIQTILEVSKSSVDREVLGINEAVEHSSPESGELPTITQLILSICEELLPFISNLVKDSFASHVIRVLLSLLYPKITILDPNIHKASFLRSKKSAKHRAKQGPMKSIFGNDERSNQTAEINTPFEFEKMARDFLLRLRKDLNENEIRALAADKVACPTLSMFIQLEAFVEMSEESGSLLDCISVGLVSACNNNTEKNAHPASDYLMTLLREPIASHLLENLVLLVPKRSFAVLWEQYFYGKLNKLAVHPVANYVVAKAIERLDIEEFSFALREMEHLWPKIIKTARCGVLKACVDQSCQLMACEDMIMEGILNAFGLNKIAPHRNVVHCILALKTLQDFEIISNEASDVKGQHNPTDSANKSKEADTISSYQPNMQGALILQSIFKLRETYNQVIVDSIGEMSISEILVLAHHPISSRVLDAFLELNSIPRLAKRKLISSLIGHYHLLVDDRTGSYVGDRCWTASDPYLREKIARSLTAHEQFLAASFYGKYFAKKLKLHLLQQKPDTWKALQTSGSTGNMHPEKNVIVMEEKTIPRTNKRKRESNPEDEIDAVFNAALGKSLRRGQLLDTSISSVTEETKPSDNATRKNNRKGDLNEIFGAIRAAPSDNRISRNTK